MLCLPYGFLPSYISDYQLRQLLESLDADAQHELRKRVSAHNRTFVIDEMERHRLWFDTVEKTPLTSEQRKAAVIMEDRNLLVAAAGSGKTSTMVAKVGYALRTGCHVSTDILVLAFNNKAARELSQRMHKCLHDLLPPGQGVKTKTFHALGLEIITAVCGRRPRIGMDDQQGQSDVSRLKTIITRLIHTEPGFAQEWMLFRLFYCREVRDPASFSTARQWRHFVLAHGTVDGRLRGFLTFNGELVVTQCEQAVGNWLYLHGFAYVYKNGGSGLWKRLGRYRAGTGFLLTDSQILIHAGDRAGGWLYPENTKGLVLEVSFEDFMNGRLFRVLRRGLKRFGLSIHPVAQVAVIRHLGDSPSAEELRFLSDFIKHARANQVSRVLLKTRIKHHIHAPQAGVLQGFLVRVLRAYRQNFRQADLLDFPEMLSLATRYVSRGHYVHPYTLILVDEFQDTSQASAGLLIAMLRQVPSCKLFAVGDDWQSIYRFAGADNEIFTRFEDYFGAAAINYLSTSFRFNQAIADTATTFILKNPQQIRKRVSTLDCTTQDAVVIRPYRNHHELSAACNASLADIQHACGNGKGATVYILSRYRHQLPTDLAIWRARYAALDIQFMTIHAAKGLEADYVLVLGLHGGRHAFPARINNDPLLQLVMPAPEAWPDAEERRLLYVAITRARHKVYLITSMYDKSDFVTELAEYSTVQTLDLPNGQ